MYDSRRSERYPIDDYKRHILYLLEKNQIVIVVGETGSGKSTRIPQFLLFSGSYNDPIKNEKGTQNKFQQICITQPRRVAAVQLAQRLSQEISCDLGSTVGYAIRFADLTNPEQTMIKFMTEGLLLRELTLDPKLERYSVIMIDEVHERNLNTDIILGLLKCIIQKRSDLKLIICSATAKIDEIREFFTFPHELMNKYKPGMVTLNGPAVLIAKGKSHPLKIYYSKEPVPNYLDATVETVKAIHENNRLASGKILVFITGQDEVEYVCERLNDYCMSLVNRLDLLQLLPLPLHASLKSEEITRAFDEHGRNTRVCIVSTNIAETSLTIRNVGFVVDCGYAKLKMYDCNTGIDSLVRTPISKSSAKQRAGRAGRTREGVVYRLYPESQYKSLSESTIPEIQRSPLMEVILTLKSLGVDDVTRFPLMSKMPRKNLVDALKLLHALHAIDERGDLTNMGELMAQFSLDPRISRLIVGPESTSCTREACKIAAILQVRDIFTKSAHHINELWSNSSLVKLLTSDGDIISYLNIMNSFVQNHKSHKWAEKRNLNYQALMNAVEIAEKLQNQCKTNGIPLNSTSSGTELIQRSVVSGLFPNAAYLHPSGDYRTVRGDQVVHVHPTSVFNEMMERPKLVVFVKIINTTKPYMQHIMATNQSMLLDAAPHYYTFSTNLEMMRNKYP